jgi:ERCC4-type nuclease
VPTIDNWIRLAKLESPKRAIAIVDHFGSPEEALRAHAQELANVDGISAKTASRVRELASEPVDHELRALDKVRHRRHNIGSMVNQKRF